MVKEADALKSDINSIMARWIAHGEPPGGAVGQARYGDFSNVNDYHEGLSRIREADRAFAQLNPAIRKHVKNDPAAFLEMVYDPDRRGELEELGMLPHQAPADAPAAVEPVATPPAQPPA